MASSASADVFEATAGVKGFAGGNLWTTPSDGPGSDGLGFVKSGGGFGWGAGAYVEARALKFLGLELGVTYDKSAMHRDVTYSSVTEIREEVTMKSLRIPVLAKAIAPVPFGRLSLFLGPEFVQALSADASLDVTSGPGAVAADTIRAAKKNSTTFTCGLGITFDLPASLELPIELRASKNLSQESAWRDRVEVLPPAGPYTVTAQSSWDFRLGLGLGYKFF